MTRSTQRLITQHFPLFITLKNLIHREDDLQLHTLHFARHLNFFESFPCSRKQANNNKGLEKGFYQTLVTHRNFPPTAIFAWAYFFISRCQEKELIAVFKLPTRNARATWWTETNSNICYRVLLQKREKKLINIEVILFLIHELFR